MIGDLTVTSEAGTEIGDTKISVAEALGEGHKYKYKIADAEVDVEYWDNVQNWSLWDGESDITAASGKVITLVECTGDYHALNAGSATVVAAEEAGE